MTAKDEAFKAFDEGKRTSDIKGLAKPKTLYNYFDLWKKSRNMVQVDTGSALPPTGNPTLPSVPTEKPKGDGGKPKPAGGSPGVSPFVVSMYRMVSQQAVIYNTPIIWTGFAYATLEGFTGSFQDFLELAIFDFWRSRGRNPFTELGSLLEQGGKANEERGLGVDGQQAKDGTAGEQLPTG